VPPALAAAEADLLSGLDDDLIGRLAVQALTTADPGEGDGADRWTVTGLDPEGCDLRRGGYVARVDFDQRIQDPESARLALSRLAEGAGQPGPRQPEQGATGENDA
jgi:hypothetical protein